MPTERETDTQLRRTMSKRRTFKEKQDWILARLDAQWEVNKRVCKPPFPPSISSSEEEDEEAWHQEFGGHRKYYTMGPCVSPDFARTLRKMWLNGLLYRYVGGNQDVKSFRMKTYYISYSCKRHVHEAVKLGGVKVVPDDYEG